MESTKTKLLYVLEILKETDENHPLTATQICKKLSLYGMESERKSVSRDVHTLMECGYDIIPCADKRLGYFMASRLFEDWELKVLIDAVNGAKFITERASKDLTDRLVSMASVDSQKMLKRIAPVITPLKTEHPAVKQNIDLVLRAIRTSRKIGFQYAYTDNLMKTQLRREGFTYVVSPYALFWENESYYLICNTENHADLSNYRMERIRNLAVLDQPSTPVKDIAGENPANKIREYIFFSIYHYDGEKIRLTLCVPNKMIDQLAERFGRSLVIDTGKEKSTVTVSTYESPGLYFWLLQYGEYLEVVSPENVRERYLHKLHGILAHYASPHVSRKDE